MVKAGESKEWRWGDASKQTTKINNVEHANCDDREIRSVKSQHPREWPNFRDKVQVELYEESHGSFHKLGDLTRRTISACFVKLCEDTSKTYSQFKRGSSFEKDFSMIEVVIEQLIGVHSFTFIRFRSILIKREMFLLCCFACYLICYLSISSPGKITNRERDKYHVILRKFEKFCSSFSHYIRD